MHLFHRLLPVAALTAVAVGVAVTPATAGPPDKGNVCHDGDNGWEVISIAEPAFDSHIAHGDAFPGEPVPGMENRIFDDDCAPMTAVIDTDGDGVPDDLDQCPGFDDSVDIDGLGMPDYCETVHAVAYLDVFPSPGGYDLAEDLLIAKLIDNGDGVVGAGDVVYAGDITTEFCCIVPIQFLDKVHYVDLTLYDTSEAVSVITADGERFDFLTNSRFERYAEYFTSGARVTQLNDDFIVGASDLIEINSASPSLPDLANYNDGELFLLKRGYQASDDAFVDVQIG